mgnify:CR=1 FL=1
MGVDLSWLDAGLLIEPPEYQGGRQWGGPTLRMWDMSRGTRIGLPREWPNILVTPTERPSETDRQHPGADRLSRLSPLYIAG